MPAAADTTEEKEERMDAMHGVVLHPERRRLAERGAVTAEYAIATIAAVGFAALLVVLLRSDLVRGLLTDLIRHALTMPV